MVNGKFSKFSAVMNNFAVFIKIASRGTLVLTAFHGSEVLNNHVNKQRVPVQ